MYYMSFQIKHRAIWIYIVLSFLLMTSPALAKGLSPYSMGLKDAKNGIERYWVLYNTHKEASERGVQVDYKDIDSLSIEIPKDAKPIPISKSCDFKGLRIHVINKELNLFLFEISQDAEDIVVNKQMIDNGDFTTIPQLSQGEKLLFVKDLTPWVKQRQFFEYGATRRESLYLKNGKALNRVIMPYNNPQSDPRCSFVSVDGKERVVSNLIFRRDSSSTHKTYLVKVFNQNGISFNNITTYTPQNDTLYGDCIYWIENCANIKLKNCTINGSYSQKRAYGYGIYMDNVYNSTFKNLKSETNWGVFCTRSMNQVFLKGCSVNRFDTHCYGRDVTCKDCYFYDRECSYTSFYGTVSYKRCIFDDCLPFHIDYTYDVYTPFRAEMKNCVFRPSKKHDSLIFGEYLLEKDNYDRREELIKNQWPSIFIKGLKIETADSSLQDVYLIKFLKNDYAKNVAFPDGEHLPTEISLQKVDVANTINFYLTNLKCDNRVLNKKISRKNRTIVNE